MSNRMSIDFLTDPSTAANESVLHPSPAADFADTSLGPGSSSSGLVVKLTDNTLIAAKTSPVQLMPTTQTVPISIPLSTNHLMNDVMSQQKQQQQQRQQSNNANLLTMMRSPASPINNNHGSVDALAQLVLAVDTISAAPLSVPSLSSLAEGIVAQQQQQNNDVSFYQQRQQAVSQPKLMGNSSVASLKPWLSSSSAPLSSAASSSNGSAGASRYSGSLSAGSRSPSLDGSEYNSSSAIDNGSFSGSAPSSGTTLADQEIERLFLAARSNRNAIKGWRDAAMLALLLDLKLSCQKIADLRYRDVRGILDGSFNGIYRFGRDKSTPIRTIGCHEITVSAIIGWTNAVKSAYGWTCEDDAPLFVPLSFTGDVAPQTARLTALKRDAVSKVFTALKGNSGVAMNKEVVNRTHFRKFRPSTTNGWSSSDAAFNSGV